MQTKKSSIQISFEMAEPRGTQIKNLPRVNTLDSSDVIVKQKTLQDNSQTQGISINDVMSYTRQQLLIPQILQDITDIQQQITTIIQKSDVADIVNCYDNEGDTSKTDIVHYDTTTLSNNDIIEVLDDETHSNSVSYYKYNSSTGTFTYIGSLSPYYNKTEIDDKLLLINNDLLKLFSYGNFALWDATKTYSLYAIVLKNNLYWRSLQDNNINHDPEEVNSQYWELFKLGGGGGSSRIGQLEFYYAPLVFEDNEVPDRIEFNGQKVAMSSYPEFKFWLKQHPEFFVSSKAQYDAIKDASATGQVGYFCWVDDTEQEVYMPIINDITFLQSLPIGAIQKQEVPTAVFKGDAVDITPLGAGVAVSDSGVGGGYYKNGVNREAYDPYLAQQADPTRGLKNYAQNGKNVRQEAVRAYIYIVAIQGDTQTNFLLDYKDVINDYSLLPATASKGDAYKVLNEITIDGTIYPSGVYAYNGTQWQLYGKGMYEITSPFCLGFSVKSKTDLASLLPTSWCKSDALPKSGATYQSLYDKLVDVDTNGTAGTITTGGTTYNTKEKDGLVVVSSTDWNAIFTATKSANVFGLDTTNQEFYLPYNKPERTLIDSYYDDADENDSEWYELYSDGLLLQGGHYYTNSNTGLNTYTKTITLPRIYDNTKYYPIFNMCHTFPWNPSNAMEQPPQRTTGSFNIVIYNPAYQGYTWQTRGYVNVPANQQTYYDYYYVGDTIQSNSVINV